MEVEKVIHVVTRGKKEEAAVHRTFPEIPWFPSCSWCDPICTFVFPLGYEQRIQEFVGGGVKLWIK